MKGKNTIVKKLLSIVLALAMVLGCFSEIVLPVNATEGTMEIVSDSSTMDDWKVYFGPEKLSTENAGGVWTDKSVLTDASAFEGATGTPITKKAEDSMLVALSTIAANMSVQGRGSVTTDTMLVLDVSKSMLDSAADLVTAANTSIRELLAMDENNRVGVVLYSSGDNNGSILLLPLGRYTTSDSSGNYLNYNSSTNLVSLNSTVKTEAGDAVTVSSRKVSGSTNIQSGILRAKEEFDSVTDITVDGKKRTPVIVLMSDGAPTTARNKFTAIGEGDVVGYSGTTSPVHGFVTQLTASYTKNQIAEKYNNDCWFYTLGVDQMEDGVSTITGSPVALSVMDPTNAAASEAVNTYWNGGTISVYNWKDSYITEKDCVGYLNVAAGEEIEVYWGATSTTSVTTSTVTKIDEPLDQNYVDKFISTNADHLIDAFEQIVEIIQMQSQYFPTLIDGDGNFSGYVSFVDRIGEYMNVTDIKGILINNQLYSGADLASNFVEGGGALGTKEESTHLGDELIRSVKTRLGIPTTAEAQQLVGLAYTYGQLSYTSPTEFSNYIGWFADANGSYLGFWDGNPESTMDGAVYQMKSYGYLGAVSEEESIAASDMMYATVQVRENIATGEQMVSFAIPATLLPVATYDVKLDADQNVTSFEILGAEHPIRLVYEVALKEGINSFNLSETVSEEYLAANTADDGTVYFYTNQYEKDDSAGYNKVNTYSYFRPSKENGRFYFLEDTYLYTKTGDTYTLYTGAKAPEGNGFYRLNTVYRQNGLETEAVEVYEAVSSQAADDAVLGADGWYIPATTPRQAFESFAVSKASNESETLPYSNKPYIDISEGNGAVDPAKLYVVGATLGNNGRVGISLPTGIKLSKEMDAQAEPTLAEFSFKLTNTTNTADSSSYAAYKTDAEGSGASATVKFNNGEAVVTLKAGETLSISGMTPGDVFTVEETETVDYVVDSVNSDGAAKTATVTVEEYKLSNAAFVNRERGEGALAISKTVSHDYGNEYQMPDKTFEMEVTLSGIGTANAAFTAVKGDAEFTVTSDAEGKFTVELKHGETITINGLPEGAAVNVVETAPGAGFQVLYNGQAAADITKAVEVDGTVAVSVTNDYTADPVTGEAVAVTAAKELTGRADNAWLDTDSFEFKLQKYNPETKAWATFDVSKFATSAQKSVDFSEILDGETYTTIGTYRYQIVEIEGNIPAVTYDKNIHSFEVHVTDKDMDGALEIDSVTTETAENTQVTAGEASWSVASEFANTYAIGDDEETVAISVTKKVVNESESPLGTLAGFKFELLDAEGNKVAESDATNATGNVVINLVYDKDDLGVHTYTLKEAVPETAAAGWSYTDKAVTVTVEITDDTVGGLESVIYTGTEKPADAGKSITAAFENTYDPSDAELTMSFVNKTLEGRALKDGEFSFAVLNADNEVVLTGQNDAAGNVVFSDTLKYSKVGTYVYTIKETSENGKGVTVDTTAYEMTVTVTDVNGVLNAEYAFADTDAKAITFENDYVPDPIENYTISGKKSIEGKPLDNAEFTFVMTEVSDAEGTPKADAVSVETKNDADGSFSFGGLKYTEAGTHYYAITEKNTGKAGVGYDDTQYVITVTVTDDGEGTLTAVSSHTESTLVFSNSYTAESTSVTLTGHKDLDGKDLEAGKFSFELYSSDAEWNEGEQIGTAVSNDADGSFSFAAMEFTEVGDYYYLVKETGAGQKAEGITYDDTTYGVHVKVTDEGYDGQLDKEVVYYDAATKATANGLNFTNIYAIDQFANVEIALQATLLGRDWTDTDSFDFTITAAEGTPMPADTAVTLGKPGTGIISVGKFGNIEYTTESPANGYVYEIKQNIPKDKEDGMLYDGHTTTVVVKVTDNGKGALEYEVTYNNSEAVTAADQAVETAAAFTNIYYVGEKTVDGAAVQAGLLGEEYTFTISYKNPTEQPAEMTIVDKLSSNLAYVEGSAGTGTTSVVDGVTVVTWDLGVVQPGEDGTVSFTAKLKESALTDVFDVTTNTADIQIGDEHETHTNTVKINDPVRKSLTISKTIDLADPVNTFINTTQTFNFEVALTDADGKVFDKALYTITGGVVTDTDETDGKFTVQLKHGESAVIANLPAGTAYTVEEVDAPDYYATQGGTERNGSIGAENADAAFTNTYKIKEDAKASVTLNGKKFLEGRETSLKDKEFTFYAYAADESFNYDKEAKAATAQNNTEGEFTLTLNYTADDVGETFYYVVEEANAGGTLAGVSHSSTKYQVTVQVTDNGTGGINAKSNIDYTLSFTNTYGAEETDVVTIPVQKTLQNREWEEGETFNFVLTKVDENAPMPVKNKISVGKDGGSFEMTFPQKGTFRYNITEEIPNVKADGILYDGHTAEVTVTVTDNGVGKLVAAVEFDNSTAVTAADKAAEEAAAFTNIYYVGEKTVDKAAVQAGLLGKEYTFTISYENPTEQPAEITVVDKLSSNLAYVEGSAGTGTASIVDGVTVVTWDIGVVQPGEGGIVSFKAKLKESALTDGVDVTTNTADIQIGDDHETHTNTVTIEDPAKYALVISKTVTVEDAANSTVNTAQGFDFEVELTDADGNVFAKDLYTITGGTVTDADPTDGKFTIQLKHGESATIANLPAGTAYVVKEAETLSYYECAGEVQRSGSIVSGDQSAAYTNIYKISDDAAATVTLNGKKTLSGRDAALKDKEFTFYAYTADSTFTYDAAAKAATAQNGVDGSFALALGYTAEDVGKTFYYVVKEANAGEKLAGVTHSSAEYHVTVTVTDNGKGGIQAVSDVTTTLNFTNTYGADATDMVSIPVQKTLENRAWTEGETFDFVLTKVDENAPMPTNSTISVGKDGGSFELKFTEKGTFRYKISESIPAETAQKDGILYDNHDVTVTVTVTDNGEGKLVVSSMSFDNTDAVTADDKAAEEAAAFTNVYYVPTKTANYAEGTPSDTLEGKVGEEFFFTISYENPTEAPAIMKIVDTLSDNLEYVGDAEGNAAAGVPEGQTITWNVGTVEPGAAGKIVFKAKLKDSALTDTQDTTINVADVHIGEDHIVQTTPVTIEDPEFYNLTVKKLVALAVEGSTTIDTAKEFTFHVSLTQADGTTQLTDSEYAYVIYNADDSQAESGNLTFTNGTAQIKVKHGQKYVIAELPAGTLATITEVDIPEGYAAEDVADATETVYIDTQSESRTFTNIYSLKPVNDVVLEAAKTLTLKGSDEIVLGNEQFGFGIYSSPECDGNPIVTGTNDGNGKVTFAPMSFDKAGTYTYYMAEIEVPEAKHINFSDAVYKVSITINDDGKGNLVKGAVVYSDLDGNEADPVFNNSYKDGYKVGKFTVQANKELLGRDIAEYGSKFNFGLYDAAGNLVAVGTNDAAGNVTFSEAAFAIAAGEEEEAEAEEPAEAPEEETAESTEEAAEATEAEPAEDAEAIPEAEELVGPTAKLRAWDITAAAMSNIEAPEGEASNATQVYWYTLREIVPENDKDKVPGISYSTESYRVKVSVVNDGFNILVEEPVYYPAEGEEPIAAADVKFVNTYEAAATSAVSFNGTKILMGRPTPLAADEFTFTVTDEANKVIEVKNDAEGKIVFDLGSFAEVGTYVFKLAEKAGDEEFMTYADEVYTVTVTVTDNGTGKLEAAVAHDGTDITFTNTYKALPTKEVIIQAVKELDGRDLEAGEFTFTAAGTDNVFEAKNDKDGNVSFNVGSMDKAGEYKFTIKETLGDAEDIEYSEEVYEVMVVVTDDGSGMLKAEVKYPAEGVVFHNTYVEPEQPEAPKPVTPAPVAPATGDTHQIISVMLLGMIAAAGLAMVMQRRKVRR